MVIPLLGGPPEPSRGTGCNAAAYSWWPVRARLRLPDIGSSLPAVLLAFWRSPPFYTFYEKHLFVLGADAFLRFALYTIHYSAIRKVKDQVISRQHSRGSCL